MKQAAQEIEANFVKTIITCNSSNQDSQHRNMVGIMINRSVAQPVLNFLILSNRVMKLQINTKRRKHITKYSQMRQHKEDQELQSFYEQIEMALKFTKTRDITIIMCHFRPKIRKEKIYIQLGNLGLGSINYKTQK